MMFRRRNLQKVLLVLTISLLTVALLSEIELRLLQKTKRVVRQVDYSTSNFSVRKRELVHVQHSTNDKRPLQEIVHTATHLSLKHLNFVRSKRVYIDQLKATDTERGKNIEISVRRSNKTKYQQKFLDEGWKKNSDNELLSRNISLRRDLPDLRLRGCKSEKYDSSLPPTSVIIYLYNEAWSILLRTVHSILDHSPPELIKEVIIVDDFSNMPHLGRQLDDYIINLPKVKVIRNKQWKGPIFSRIRGAYAAKASILTYLDSHCECATGWLPPLLQRIANKRTTVVFPIVDAINETTFEINSESPQPIYVGGFNWKLMLSWQALPQREKLRRLHYWDPVWSPTLVGVIFSIDKAFFERIGTYDKGFNARGGEENLELSFKTWMCGGTLELVPCSHVGHIYGTHGSHGRKMRFHAVRRNSVRLAEVWLDDYKKYFYQRIDNNFGDYGNVTSQKALRQKLQCKSFDWYIKNIYPEMFIPGQEIASGEVRNMGYGGDTCLDWQHSDHNLQPAGLWYCHGNGGNQYWVLTKNGEIRHDDSCLDSAKNMVIQFPCHNSKRNQFWMYDSETYNIRHVISRLCLEITSDKKRLIMSKCNENAEQKWKFEHFNSRKLPTVAYK